VTLGSSRSSSVSDLVVDGLNCLQRRDCAPSDAAPQTDGEVSRKTYPGTQTLRPLEDRQFQGVGSRQPLEVVIVIVADPIQRFAKLIGARAEHLKRP
jgi:hypothetical protein